MSIVKGKWLAPAKLLDVIVTNNNESEVFFWKYSEDCNSVKLFYKGMNRELVEYLNFHTVYDEENMLEIGERYLLLLFDAQLRADIFHDYTEILDFIDIGLSSSRLLDVRNISGKRLNIPAEVSDYSRIS